MDKNNTIKELKQEALERLGKRVAQQKQALDELDSLTNDFDIEAKLYFIGSLANQTKNLADDIHRHMHLENSVSGEFHDPKCLKLGDRK